MKAKTELGERIEKQRIAKGLGTYELAKIAGVSSQTLYRYEWGETMNPSKDVIEKLAKALDVKPAQLMGWEA